MPGKWTGLSKRYAIAFGASAAATGLRVLLIPVLGHDAPYSLAYVAVVVTAAVAGRGPAVLSTLVGAVTATCLFVRPQFTSGISGGQDFAWLAFYLIVCGTVIAAIDLRTRAAATARLRLAQLQAEQERRAAAERESEQRLRWATQTLSSIGDGVITTDGEGRVTFLNPVASGLTGWTPETAAGKPIEQVFNVVNERTGQPVENPAGRVLREGIVVGLANHTALIRKDGKQVPIDDSGAPIRDEYGGVLGTVLVFRDFTERRRNEEANARLAAIVNFSQDAITSKSLDGVIQTWNPAAERLFGFTAEEAVGKTMMLLIPPGREHEESNLIESIRAGRVVEHFETVRRRKDGVDIHVSMCLSPLYNSYGELIGISHIDRDITAQKQLRAQLLQAQKLESLGVLAGGVAHNFNNLLTGIIGSGSLLLDMLPEDSQEASIARRIMAAGDRAANLTQQLLAYSGKGRFVLEYVDASKSIREIVELLQASIPRTVQLVLELPDGLPLIEVDVAQFQQVVMNLVINAAEAMGGAPGAVCIRTASRYVSSDEIECRAEFAGLIPGKFVVMQIRDNGSGMSAATLARIFDPFFTTKFTGRGLGLAAVQGIVRGHNGAIRVESELGSGTSFEVYLPVAVRPEKAPPPWREPDRLTILVADDEELVRETARLALERDGFKVKLAQNGQEALTALERDSGIALVLLDLTMPVLSGRGALEKMRALRPSVPVLLFSGYNEAEAMRQINDGEVAGFLSKPFTSESLRAKVKVVLQRSAPAGAV